jgi:hypothetical protein
MTKRRYELFIPNHAISATPSSTKNTKQHTFDTTHRSTPYESLISGIHEFNSSRLYQETPEPKDSKVFWTYLRKQFQNNKTLFVFALVILYIFNQNAQSSNKTSKTLHRNQKSTSKERRKWMAAREKKKNEQVIIPPFVSSFFDCLFMSFLPA